MAVSRGLESTGSVYPANVGETVTSVPVENRAMEKGTAWRVSGRTMVKANCGCHMGSAPGLCATAPGSRMGMKRCGDGVVAQQLSLWPQTCIPSRSLGMATPIIDARARECAAALGGLEAGEDSERERSLVTQFPVPQPRFPVPDSRSRNFEIMFSTHACKIQRRMQPHQRRP